MSMSYWLLDFLALLGLSTLAAAMVVWFYWMRRKVLKLIKKVVDDLEGFFKPIDKTYTLLGYLVGFRAIYELERGDRLFIVLTTTPRHSLTYYPLLKLLGRTDRLQLALKPSSRYVLRELHVVDARDKRSLQILARDLGERINWLSRVEHETPKGVYLVYYESPEDLDFVKRVIEHSPVHIYKLSAYTRENLVEVVADISSGDATAVAKVLRDFSGKITRMRATGR
jgi:hypothetical protein